MHRAYSVWSVKSIDADRRVITGIATTPTIDRVGDVVEPLGIQYQNPLPLLLHHDQTQPVGTVIFDTPTAKSVTFTASLPFVPDPGTVRDRVDEAWHSLKAGLIRGASIGFKPIEIKKLHGGRFHILKSLVAELSLVTLPANLEATILTVKSAALGERAKPMTIQQQITECQTKRAAEVAVMAKTLEDSGSEPLDPLASADMDARKERVAGFDKKLALLAEQETLQLANARRVAPAAGAPYAHVEVKSLLPPETAFVRYVKCLALGRGDSMRTIEIAKSFTDTPDVEWMIKAAVAAGTTTDATWAGPLVPVTPSTSAFLELLRASILIGRIPGMTEVPANTSVNSQTGGGTYGWVGEGAPKPVTAAQFGLVTVPFHKAAGIIVLTEELIRNSSPSAESLVRKEMIDGLTRFLDAQFITPAVALVAGVNPASITNGAATAAASGATGAAAKADLAKPIAAFTTANLPLSESVWIMNEANAWGLSQSLNALAQPLFPGISAAGGTLYGRPVVVSNTAGSNVILVHTPSILYVNQGGLRIDVSREASIQMDSAPVNPPIDTTVYRSMFQENKVAFRVEHATTWLKARTAAVYYLSAAAYTGA